MKYRLATGINLSIASATEIQKAILESRGVNDVDTWLNGGQSETWRDFEKPIIYAVDMLNKAVSSDRKICIIVDSDCDGFSSAAIIINFMTEQLHVPVENISWVLHEGKSHGLADTIDKIYDDISLVVVPDAGTTDIEQHAMLVKRGTDVLILDHHEDNTPNQHEKSGHVVIVNNQTCEYANKSLTGAGVTWKFIQAYSDIILGKPSYDGYGDLCAFGNISDMADYRNHEIRYIVSNYFIRSELTNPFLRELAETNSYTLKKHGGYCYRGCSFAITPFVNAICRSGTMDEKRFVFESMLECNRNKMVKSSKRGESYNVTMATEAVTIANRVKARQTKEQDNAMSFIDYDVSENNLTQHSVLAVKCDKSVVRPEVAGLCANKMQDEYGMASMVLIDYPDEEVYRGSIRNNPKSPIDDFRKTLEDTGLVNYAAGHASAAGVEVAYGNFDRLIKKLDSTIDKTCEKVDNVDCVIDMNDTTAGVLVVEISNMSRFWGQGIEPSKVAVSILNPSRCNISLMSPDRNPTLKIKMPNGVELIKFHSNQDEVNKALKCTSITAIGAPSVNEWNGKTTPQVIIDDIEMVKEYIF